MDISESQVKNRIRTNVNKFFKNIGVTNHKINMYVPGIGGKPSGWPDFEITAEPVVVLIEAKAPKKKLRLVQEIRIKQILQETGWPTLIIDEVQEYAEFEIAFTEAMNTAVLNVKKKLNIINAKMASHNEQNQFTPPF